MCTCVYMCVCVVWMVEAEGGGAGRRKRTICREAYDLSVRDDLLAINRESHCPEEFSPSVFTLRGMKLPRGIERNFVFSESSNI